MINLNMLNSHSFIALAAALILVRNKRPIEDGQLPQLSTDEIRNELQQMASRVVANANPTETSSGIHPSPELSSTLLASPQAEPLLSALYAVGNASKGLQSEVISDQKPMKEIENALWKFQKVVSDGLQVCCRHLLKKLDLSEHDESLQILAMKSLSVILCIFSGSLIFLRTSSLESRVAIDSQAFGKENCNQVLRQLRSDLAFPLMVKLNDLYSLAELTPTNIDPERRAKTLQLILQTLLFPLNQLKEATIDVDSNSVSKRILNGFSEIIAEEAAFQLACIHGKWKKLAELSSNDLDEMLLASGSSSTLASQDYLDLVSSYTLLIKSSARTLETSQFAVDASIFDPTSSPISTSQLEPQEREPRLEQTLAACIPAFVMDSSQTRNSRVPVEGEDCVEVRKKGGKLIREALEAVYEGRSGWNGKAL